MTSNWELKKIWCTTWVCTRQVTRRVCSRNHHTGQKKGMLSPSEAVSVALSRQRYPACTHWESSAVLLTSPLRDQKNSGEIKRTEIALNNLVLLAQTAICADRSIWNETFNAITLISVFSGRTTAGMCSTDAGSRSHRKQAGMSGSALGWVCRFVGDCAPVRASFYAPSSESKQVKQHLPADEFDNLLTIIKMQCMIGLLFEFVSVTKAELWMFFHAICNCGAIYRSTETQPY